MGIYYAGIKTIYISPIFIPKRHWKVDKMRLRAERKRKRIKCAH